MNGELERKDVKFTATKSKQENCLCRCCHGTGSVTMLELPVTYYADGKDLFTRYDEWWLCDDCRIKLLYALRERENEA